MKVLIASGKGKLSTDFCYVKDGELVVPAFPTFCIHSKRDGLCECGSTFLGLGVFEGMCGTTTAVVIESPIMTREGLVDRLKGAYNLMIDDDLLAPVEDDIVQELQQCADDTVLMASRFPHGTVVELLKGDVVKRGG